VGLGLNHSYIGANLSGYIFVTDFIAITPSKSRIP
jgi:hypothetical protein